MTKSSKNNKAAIAENNRANTSNRGNGEATDDAPLVPQNIVPSVDSKASPKAKLDEKFYETELRKLQVELVKVQE